ncbi:MAG: hypothetical protein NZ870_03635 [bacterium]|nr:hypothetical protein [bacterium]
MVGIKKHILVFLALSIAFAYIHMYFRDFVYTSLREAMHNSVINGSAPAPIQYRILTPYIAELLDKIFDFKYVYGIIRGLFYFLSILMVYNFLKKHIPDKAILGSYIFSSYIPFTYILYYYQETDPINIFFYVLAYYIVSIDKTIWLFIILPIAMLNRETPILIPLFYFIQKLEYMNLWKLLLSTALMAFECITVYAALRFIYKPVAYSEFFYLEYNLTDFETYLFVGVLFLPWLLFGGGSKFSKRAILFSIFFLIFHYIITIVKETRLLLPILPLFILHGLSNKYERAFSKNLSYVFISIMIPLFIAATFGFYRITEVLNIETLRKMHRPMELIKEGLRLEQEGLIVEAVNKYETALLFVEDVNVRQRLCFIYLNYLYNEEAFLKHFNKIKGLADIEEVNKLELMYEMQKNRFKIQALPPKPK